MLLMDILTVQTTVFDEIERLKRRVMEMMAEDVLPNPRPNT